MKFPYIQESFGNASISNNAFKEKQKINQLNKLMEVLSKKKDKKQ